MNLLVTTGKPEYEVNERTEHTLTVKNESSRALTLPSFRFLNRKGEDSEVAFYVKEQILHIQVARDNKVIPIKEHWRTPPEKPSDFPTIHLGSGESVSISFSLTLQWFPSFYDLTEPGYYTVTVTLDTSRIETDRTVRGVFSSSPSTFRIIPVPTFRMKELNESQGDFVRAKVVFYLDRIEKREGEYFPNVSNILHTQGAVPALIQLLDVSNDGIARHARAILGQIHHRGYPSQTQALPATKEEWEAWWQKEAGNLTPQELWSNFGSHYQ